MEIDTEKRIIVTDMKSILRCTGFCLTDDTEEIRKEFYDWYLKEDEFPITKGVFIIEPTKEMKEFDFVVEFDFTEPDELLFDVIRKGSSKKMAQFNFYRQENLTMTDVSIEVDFIQIKEFEKLNNIVWDQKTFDKVRRDTEYKIKHKMEYHTKREGRRKIHDGMYREIALSMCKTIAYSMYSTMFYMIKREPIHTDASIKKLNEVDSEYVLQEYKYNGFIDINKRSVIRVAAERDPSLPIRDYTRHIGSWTVRGHYRRIKGELVWIKPHTRGEGELEQRVYGTDESQAKTFKIFHVFRRKVYSKSAIRPPKPSKERQESPVLSMFRRFLNLFKSA